AHHFPVDGLVPAMHGGAGGLGRWGIEQVGAAAARRMHMEQQDQERLHQRAAADAGEADERADDHAAQDVERINVLEEILHGPHLPGALETAAPFPKSRGQTPAVKARLHDFKDKLYRYDRVYFQARDLVEPAAPP